MIGTSNRDVINRHYGSTYLLYCIFGILFLFVANLGYWQMKKWGVYTYIAIIIISLFLYYFLDLRTSIIPYLIPQLICLAVGLKNYQKLT